MPSDTRFVYFYEINANLINRMVVQGLASNYSEQWLNLSLSVDRSHVVAHYGQDDSYSLMYNLFAHKLLQLDLLPDSVSG